MNYKSFSSLLENNGGLQIEIIKNSQICGRTLVNRTNHPNSTYPADFGTPIHPGQIFNVLSVHLPNTVFSQTCLKVSDSTNTFYICQSDFRRFIKTV